METRIQGGCVATGPGSYVYKYFTEEGDHTVEFISATVPKIGDLIVNGVLQPLEEPLTNQDHSRWIKQPRDTWPENKF